MSTKPNDGCSDRNNLSCARRSFADIEARMRGEELGLGQGQTLDLKPWQMPTADLFYEPALLNEILAGGPNEEVGSREYTRAVLARQLRDNHLSLFEPDPRRALDDPAYRVQIDDRVCKLAADNKDGLSDEVIEHVMMLAPYPLLREEADCVEFRRLLDAQPKRDFDACVRAMRVMWQKKR